MSIIQNLFLNWIYQHSHSTIFSQICYQISKISKADLLKNIRKYFYGQSFLLTIECENFESKALNSKKLNLDFHILQIARIIIFFDLGVYVRLYLASF